MFYRLVSATEKFIYINWKTCYIFLTSSIVCVVVVSVVYSDISAKKLMLEIKKSKGMGKYKAG